VRGVPSYRERKKSRDQTGKTKKYSLTKFLRNAKGRGGVRVIRQVAEKGKNTFKCRFVLRGAKTGEGAQDPERKFDHLQKDKV